MITSLKGPLAALLVSVVLIAVYVGFGGGSYEPMAVANPCEQRDVSVLEARGTFEAIALSALDGAACDLQVSREDLTLALADEDATDAFAAAHHISSDDLDAAVRAGLVRAVDDAAAAGKISGIEEMILREIAQRAPVSAAITALQALPGDDSIQSLLTRLGPVTNLQLPSLEDLPSLDGLQGLIP
jgi:hypothetical protein